MNVAYCSIVCGLLALGFIPRAYCGDSSPENRPIAGLVSRLGTSVTCLWQEPTAHKIAISASGAHLAVGRSPSDSKEPAEHRITLWGVPSASSRRECTGHTDLVHSVGFSPDERHLVSGSNDGTVRVWQVASGKEVLQLTTKSITAAFSADGKSILSASKDGIVFLFEFPSGKILKRFDVPHKRLSAVAFSPDGAILATTGNDSNIRLSNIRTGNTTCLDCAAKCLAFSFDGKQLATGGRDKFLRVWDLTTKKPRLTIPTDDGDIAAVSWFPDGKTLVSATFRFPADIRFWDTATGLELGQYRKGKTDSRDLALAADGRLLATTEGFGRIRLWDMTRVQTRTPVIGHQSVVDALSFSPDSGYLMAGSVDGTLSLWQTVQGKQLHQWPCGSSRIADIAFSRAQKKAAVAHWDGTTIFSIPDGKKVRHIGMTDPRDTSTRAIAFAPNGHVVALAGSFKEIGFFDLTSGLRKAAYSPSNGRYPRPRSMAFSYDGHLLSMNYHASAEIDSWRIIDGKHDSKVSIDGVRFQSPLVSLPHGLFVATVHAYDQITVWHLKTGKPDAVTSFKAAELSSAPVISHDGRSVATSHKGELKLWETASGKLIRAVSLGTHTGIRAMTFAPNNRMLAAQAEDLTILVFDLTRMMFIDKQKSSTTAELWKELASPEPSIAYDCLSRLVTDPENTLAFARSHVRPASSINLAELAKVMKSLESDSYATRETATKRLETLEELVEPELKATATGSGSPEAKKRAEAVLTRLANSQKRVFSVRVVNVLEAIGNAEASRILRNLANGNRRGWVTQEASAALLRMTRDRLAQDVWQE